MYTWSLSHTHASGHECKESTWLNRGVSPETRRTKDGQQSEQKDRQTLFANRESQLVLVRLVGSGPQGASNEEETRMINEVPSQTMP